MDVIVEARTLLLAATAKTVMIFAGSLVLMLVVSLVAGLASLSRVRLVRVATIAYIELFRGTSLVVQLFWLYFALPAFGISLSAFQAAVLALGLCYGAYGAEAVRSAILAVPGGQYEAATALNIDRFTTMRRIVFPQALLIVLPPLAGLLVLLLKSTATASLITVPELTFEAYTLNVRTMQTTSIFTVVLLIYFVLALVISRSARLLERYIGRWR